MSAEGTPAYKSKVRLCTEGLLREYGLYVERTKTRVVKLKSSSKRWWKLSNSLMFKSGQVSAIPPILGPSGVWCMTPREKAQVFADTFANKYVFTWLVGDA